MHRVQPLRIYYATVEDVHTCIPKDLYIDSVPILEEGKSPGTFVANV